MVKYSVLFLSILFFSCSDIYEKTEVSDIRHGLQHVAIEIAEEDYYNLTKETIVNEWFAISLQKDGKKEYGRLRRHGGYSRKKLRPSYKTETSQEWVYSSQNFDSSYCAYRLSASLFEDADISVGEVRQVFLTINRKDQGIYLSREPIDSLFFYYRNLEPLSVYSLVAGAYFSLKGGYNTEISFDKEYPTNSLTRDDLNELLAILDKGVNDNTRNDIEKIIDIPHFLRYYAVTTLISHFAGTQNNLYFWKSRKDGKFRFVPWDLDLTLGCHSTYSPEVLPQYSNGFFEKVVAYAPYKEIYINNCKTLFNKEVLLDRLAQYADEIGEAYKYDEYYFERNVTLESQIKKIERYIHAMDAVVSQL